MKFTPGDVLFRYFCCFCIAEGVPNVPGGWSDFRHCQDHWRACHPDLAKDDALTKGDLLIRQDRTRKCCIRCVVDEHGRLVRTHVNATRKEDFPDKAVCGQSPPLPFRQLFLGLFGSVWRAVVT